MRSACGAMSVGPAKSAVGASARSSRTEVASLILGSALAIPTMSSIRAQQLSAMSQPAATARVARSGTVPAGASGPGPVGVGAGAPAARDGLARAGVAGTSKHLPGHGRAGADSHKELPTVTASEAELEVDLAPFKALNQTPIGMTGHIRFTAWDAE
ncbi:MAG: beta-hexosaminidase, partial [Novosphingobium sp.]|nr:beta-hexosaminidase [Novosphingobium sp.]